MNKVPTPLPRVWIAPIEDVREKSTARFDTVVSVCQDTCWENVSHECETKHFSLADDEESARNWGGSVAYEEFRKAANFVLGAMNAQNKVLVHCHSGQNRSCSVVAAALAVYHNEDYEWAANLVSKVRPMNPSDIMESHARRFAQETFRITHIYT